MNKHCNERLPQVTTGYHRLPQVTTGYHRLPQVTTGYHRLPQVTTGYHRLPQVTTGYHRLPQVTTGYHRLPQVTTGYHRLPQPSCIMSMDIGITNQLIFTQRNLTCGFRWSYNIIVCFGDRETSVVWEVLFGCHFNLLVNYVLAGISPLKLDSIWHRICHTWFSCTLAYSDLKYGWVERDCQK